jgi:predicted transcriptional regulator
MKISEILVDKIFLLSSEDAAGKALNICMNTTLTPLPVTDNDGRYVGTKFASEDVYNSSLRFIESVTNLIVEYLVYFQRKTRLIVSYNITRQNRSLIIWIDHIYITVEYLM